MATQAQRRSTTRSRLLDAAAAVLVDQGYERLTTTEVVRRSGLSQGALFNHFATKQELVAAMAEHLFAQLRDEYEAAFGELAAREAVTIDEALTLLGASMSDERYHAAIDLYAAARTDADLQARLQPVVEHHSDLFWRLAVELPIVLSPSEQAIFASLVRLATRAFQGAALQVQARPDEPAVEQVVEAIAQIAGFAAAADAA